jgi:uncharacterized membrane protein YagU involved in acid resistance
MSRILIGALGGIGGTIVMTAVMRRLHTRLNKRSKYTLPPREIIDVVVPHGSERARRSLTTFSHFGYGAAAGALFAAILPRGGVLAGATYGTGVWVGSYLGWIPSVRILVSAVRHPAQRNILMIAAHLVWGAAMALTIQEVDRAENSIFRAQSSGAGPAAVPDAAISSPFERRF